VDNVVFYAQAVSTELRLSDGALQAIVDGTTYDLLTTTEYPEKASIYGDEIITSVTVASNLDTTTKYGYFVGPLAANAADGDEYFGGFVLKAGTYTLHHLGRTGGAFGMTDYYIDGVAAATGVDWYAGSSGANVEKTASVTVSTDGYHVLKVKLNRKNASSTDYVISITKIWFTPAAY
jgi:hypothetical protein